VTYGVGYLTHAFDLINVGDLDLIAQARRHCSRLIVGVWSDELVTALTGRPPIVPLSERLALVSHVRGVAAAVVHEAGSLPAEADVMIFVEQDRADADHRPTIQLVATRFTESAALRSALEPIGEAVA
jgi:glycerol-3-phosphate cytidylyltransferase-like family protein